MTDKCKGNGSKIGYPVGHKTKSFDNSESLLYGQGCKDWTNCFTCQKVDCTYDHSRECKRRNKLANGN